jgi:hypothetical protein
VRAAALRWTLVARPTSVGDCQAAVASEARRQPDRRGS